MLPRGWLSECGKCLICKVLFLRQRSLLATFTAQ